MLKLKLKKNLKREIKRGHQWLYKDAFELPTKVNSAQLALLKDGKEDLAWGFYDPHSPIAFRVLHVGKSMLSLKEKFMKALSLRSSLIRSEATTGYRLFNGEGDLLAGLVCDVYASVAVVQFDGKGPGEFWRTQGVEAWILENISNVKTVVFKPRRSESLELLAGEKLKVDSIKFLENGVTFSSNLKLGQKTGFFLDQRDNRDYVRLMSESKEVVNLFSYTGGFSVYAGLGGARKVISVDISKGAIEEASNNWKLNNLDESKHEGVAEDVFKYIESITDKKDMIIVDPPSMTSSKDSKNVALSKYIDLFSKAAEKVKSGGDLVLSSCSSQVSFEDFDNVAKECLSKSRRKAQILRVSGQGIDHPYPHNQQELRYLKFMHLALD